jgi:hypothetical protein
VTSDELRAAMRAITAPDTPTPPRHTWARYRWELARHVERDNPAEFLRWSTVYTTMFVGDAPFVPAELATLEASPGWERWRVALEEPGFGNPPRLSYAPYTSGNLVHQVTHAATFEHLTGLRLDKLKSVVEFGGGYGAMRLVLHTLGFRGTYAIYDTPEYSLLQRYYLSHAPDAATSFVEVYDGQFAATERADLLIGVYSLSEVDADLRRRFLTQVRADAYLLAFQDVWDGVAMPAEFKAWADTRPDLEWHWKDNPVIPGHAYLCGHRRREPSNWRMQ